MFVMCILCIVQRTPNYPMILRCFISISYKNEKKLNETKPTSYFQWARFALLQQALGHPIPFFLWSFHSKHTQYKRSHEFRGRRQALFISPFLVRVGRAHLVASPGNCALWPMKSQVQEALTRSVLQISATCILSSALATFMRT